MAGNSLQIPKNRLTPDRIGRIFAATLLVVGLPRVGKFWGLINPIRRFADSREGGGLFLFPQANENAKLLTCWLQVDGHARRVWTDSLDSVEAVLPLIFLVSSKHPNPYVRAMENAAIRDRLIQLIARGRKEPIEHQPLVLELLIKAIDLCLIADCDVTISHLLAIGKVGHPLFHEVLDHCPDSESHWYWSNFPLHRAAMRKEIAALWRILEQKFGHPQIIARESKEALLKKLLEDAMFVIVEGGESERATSTYLSLLSMMSMQIVRNHYSQTGSQLPTFVLADELRFGLFSIFELRCIQQLVKAGLIYAAIGHSLRLLPDPNENREALQSFQGFHFFKCSDWETAFAIAHICAGAIDPYMVHHQDRRTVQRHAGFDEIRATTHTRSRGESGDRDTMNDSIAESTRLVPRYSYEEEVQDRYFALEDQFKEHAADMLRAAPRERRVCLNGQVYWETVPELELPWAFPELMNSKYRRLLKSIQERPDYRVPTLPPSVEMRSNSSHGSTRSTSIKSSNGHNGDSRKKSPSDPSRALRALLQNFGKPQNGHGSSEPSS